MDSSSLQLARHFSPSAWDKFSSITELLGIVFVFAIEETGSPLTLSSVCRRWRDVARATPMLWTDIRLRLFRVRGEEDMARHFAHLKRWLYRSGACPISVYFRAHLNDMDPYITSLIELLMSHTQRWREGNFDVACIENALPLLERFNSSTFPILEKLYLTYNGSFQDSPQGGFLLDLSGLGRLSSLTFSAYEDYDDIWILLPSSLVELTVFRLSVRFIPDMVVPHLRSLSLSYIEFIDDIFPDIPHIFPCLEELEVHGQECEESEIVDDLDVPHALVFPSLTKLNLSKDALYLLHLMCTPHLTYLKLEDDCCAWNAEVTGRVVDFLWTSHCQESLVRMYISAELWKQSYLIDILEAAPNLEVIGTHNVRITDPLLVALTISKKCETGHGFEPSARETLKDICPNLKEILFSTESSYADPISVEVAISFILSRSHYQDVSINTDEAEDQPARRPSLQRIKLPMEERDIANIKDDPRVSKASPDLEVLCALDLEILKVLGLR